MNRLVKLKTILSKISPNSNPALTISKIPERSITGLSYKYYELKTEEESEKYTEFEKSYEEFNHVLKLLPPLFIPPPPPSNLKTIFPSGWKPPSVSPSTKELQYFIRRTKNHLLPVYLEINTSFGTPRRLTKIKQVEGNIWALEKEIGNHLMSLHPFPKTIIKTWVREERQSVFIHGDFEDDVKNWILKQGF